MRRIVATCLVGVLALTACTGDGEEDVGPTETPSDTASATEPDDEETSEEPTEADETASDEAGEGDATEDGPADDETTEAAAPASTESEAPALASPAREDVAVGTDGTAFRADDGRTRRRTASGGCPVQPAADEDVVACVSGFARSDGRQTAVVVSRLDGRDDVTVYDDAGDSGWRSTLVARDVVARPDLRLAPWSGRDDAFVVAFPDRDELVLAGGDAGSRVLGVLRGADDRDVSYVARRVVVRSGDTIEVLEPTADGLAGTATTASDGSSAEDVALRLYAAWVAGDVRAVADLGTDDVIDALDGTPVDSDVFALDGTSCPVSDGTATCTFRFDDTVLRWHVERTADGVQVVDLD